MERTYGPLKSSAKITHLNGNHSDNRRGDLHLTDRTGINLRQKISCRNKSEIKGVNYISKYKGKEMSKMFSVQLYGRDRAKQLASRWRADQIERHRAME